MAEVRSETSIPTQSHPSHYSFWALKGIPCQRINLSSNLIFWVGMGGYRSFGPKYPKLLKRPLKCSKRLNQCCLATYPVLPCEVTSTLVWPPRSVLGVSWAPSNFTPTQNIRFEAGMFAPPRPVKLTKSPKHLVGRPTQLIFISDIHLDDQHRNANMNDKDHLVGQLTNTHQDLIRDSRARP